MQNRYSGVQISPPPPNPLNEGGLRRPTPREPRERARLLKSAAVQTRDGRRQRSLGNVRVALGHVGRPMPETLRDHRKRDPSVDQAGRISAPRIVERAVVEVGGADGLPETVHDVTALERFAIESGEDEMI